MRPLRRPAAAALFAAAALLPAAGCDRHPSLDPKRPPLAVEPPVLRLPRIPFGGAAGGEFRLRNEGDEPLVITGIGPTGCDCAVAELRLPSRSGDAARVRVQDRGMHLALAPGEEAILGITLDTRRYREPVRFKASNLPIQFEGWDYVALEYSADIWVPFWTEPWAVQLGTIGARERKPGLVAVRALEETDFEILAPSEIDGWELQVERAGDDPAAYRITVLPPPELPLGGLLKEFELATSIPDMPVRFTVLAQVVADVVHGPDRLLLRPRQGVTEAELSVRTVAEGGRLHILAAEVEAPTKEAWPVRIEPLEPDRAWRVVVGLPAGVEPPLRATLVVTTDDPETPRIEVPIQVFDLPAPSR
ncbi:MAG: DUF1573 domain-containing protein [Planctomycetota bacterium]|nr:MAG: DUF1573 domain-containing protein [Planctomycetota bacterium]